MTSPASLDSLRIINAVGYATRVGGSAPAAPVREAMAWAQTRYFEIDDLLAEASRVIADTTGSEAGLVTCSASAALTLGAAAVLARLDLAVMEALPDVSGLTRTEFLYARQNAYDYDHPISASGGRVVPLVFEAKRIEEQLAEAIGPRTAGVVFVWRHRDERELIARIGTFCRQRNLPFLLDAAMGLPPAENLSDFCKLGPHLVTLSGGKHLGGPQNSGLLFGDRDLITSAWLQMVDMDVRAGSWSLGALLKEGVLERPPRHGIGRGFKVGKDALVGCLTALLLYNKRDFRRERKDWETMCRRIADEVNRQPLKEGVTVRFFPENGTGQYPVVVLAAASEAQMNGIKADFKKLPPKILLAESEEDGRTACLYPMCLSEDDVGKLIERAQKILWV